MREKFAVFPQLDRLVYEHYITPRHPTYQRYEQSNAARRIEAASPLALSFEPEQYPDE
jgi:hypothetical protein